MQLGWMYVGVFFEGAIYNMHMICSNMSWTYIFRLAKAQHEVLELSEMNQVISH